MQQHLHALPSFWSLYMVNRHWIMLSLHRIHASGFIHLWWKWVEDFTLLRRKTVYRELEQRFPKNHPEVVELEQLGPVSLFCAGIFCTSVGIFLLERLSCSKNYNDNHIFEIILFWK